MAPPALLEAMQADGGWTASRFEVRVDKKVGLLSLRSHNTVTPAIAKEVYPRAFHINHGLLHDTHRTNDVKPQYNKGMHAIISWD